MKTLYVIPRCTPKNGNRNRSTHSVLFLIKWRPNKRKPIPQ